MRLSKTLSILFLSLLCLPALGQNFTVTDFEESLQDVISTNVKDKNGNDCAIIKFSTQDKGFTVDNALSSFENTGDLYIYVPEGTEVLTIRHRVHRTLLYRIPIHIQSGCHYTASINIINTDLIGKVDPDKYLYGNLELNIIPFLGPTLSIGYRVKAFSAELGFTYGLSKTDDIYYYGMGASILSAYNYQAMRLGLRLGYTLPLSRQIDITPLVGVAYNRITGKEIKDVTATNSGYMDGFNTMSATLGMRVSFNVIGHLGLCVTPEYDFGIYKDDNYKLVEDNNSKLKSWTDGFGLSATLVYKF